MKKKLAVLNIMLAAVVLLCGCKGEQAMIPETLGAPEGFWLYKDNERMRTDGSERERLLDEVTLDGVTYSADEYSINRYSITYCMDTQTFFCFVTVLEEERCYVVMYDYAMKVAMQLGTQDNWRYISVSDDYVYISSYPEEGGSALYTHRGELVVEGVGNGLKRDFVYAWDYDYDTDVTTFTYWRNGETHVVSHADWDWMDLLRDDVAYDGTLYATMGNGKVVVLNMDTEEFTEFPLEGDVIWHGVKMEDGIYFLTYGKLKVTSFGDKLSKFKLYRYRDGKVEKIADFPEKLDVDIDTYGDGIINFYTSRLGKTYHYSVAEGKLKKKNVEIDTNEYFTCGEYTFWQEDKRFGFFNTKTCCYLYRRHGDTVEVMQYAYESTHSHELDPLSFFDDIREG